MGIFDDAANGLFAQYQAKLLFRDKLMGGIPGNPEVIEAWLKRGFLGNEKERQQLVLRTLIELGATPDTSLDDEEAILADAMKQVAETRNGVCFKRDDVGLYIESRQIKAMLKEVTNILYAGERWGATRKGPRNFLAERVFITPDRVHLGMTEPSGVELFVGHVSGPQGPRSTLTYYEYVEQAEVEFTVMVTQDCIEDKNWPEIWVHAQENGIGALRSQGHGRFDIIAWDCKPAKNAAQSKNGRKRKAVAA